MKYALSVPALALIATLSFSPAAFAATIAGQDYTPDQLPAVQERCNELASGSTTQESATANSSQSNSQGGQSTTMALDLTKVTLADCKAAGLIK